MIRVRLLLLAFLLFGLAGAAQAATLTVHPTETTFLAAVDTGAVLSTERFDGFAAGTVISTQIPGLVFSSPNAGTAGYVPVQTLALPQAVSPPNALGGGYVASQTVRQSIVIDFTAPTSALSFQLIAQNPVASEVTVTFDFSDGTSQMVNAVPLVESTGNVFFFGATSDTPFHRATVTSNDESGGLFSSFGGLDDLRFAALDVLVPLCAGDPETIDGILGINGMGSDDRLGDTGVASVTLGAGSMNLLLTIDPGFMPGDPTVDFRVVASDLTVDAQGTVQVTDGVGNTCELCLNFRNLPQGPTFQELVCCQDGIVFQVSNDSETPAGPSFCSSNPLGPDDPPLPPGYEQLPDDALVPCTVLTIDSPIAGDTDMVLKVDGDYEPRLRMLFSRSSDGGTTYSPWIDATQVNEPILNVIPDPTRLSGKTRWSPVKVTCAVLAELCNGIDDDGDGLIDEGLPLAGSTNDDDMDGFFLCPEGGMGLEADCNDQNPAVNPAATEICNGLDDNCDGNIDEGNPGGGNECTVADQLGLCAAGTTDCIESTIECTQVVFPVDEVCDGADNDCDGAVDEDFPTVGESCTVGLGECARTGVLACGPDGGEPVCDAVAGDPTDEVCDGLDNDCDGVADEDFPTLGDACTNGVGDCAAGGHLACPADGGDPVCDAVPGAPAAEVCDGRDNDCDGTIDNGNPGGGESCGDSDVGACELGVTECSAGSIVCTGDVGPQPETCSDGIDNDCDGETDEAMLPVAVCAMSPSLLKVQSESTSFQFDVFSMTNQCDASNPVPLDSQQMTAAWVSRAGNSVLPDPFAIDCPDATGSFLGERGIVENLADRKSTGSGLNLKFNTDSDGDCRTLDGSRQEMFALVADAVNDTTVPVCFKSTFDGVEFECCTAATVRNTGNR